MTSPEEHAAAPATDPPWEAVRDALLVPVELVADAAGGVPPPGDRPPGAWKDGSYAGAWFRDTRVLSRYQLLCEGRPLELLETEHLGPRARRHRLGVQGHEALIVFRYQLVGGPITEELLVLNIGAEPASVSFELLLDADFADMLAPDAAPGGSTRRQIDRDSLTLVYRRDGFVRGLRVAVPDQPAQISDHGFAVRADIAPRAAFRLGWTLEPFSGRTERGAPRPALRRLRSDAADEDHWVAQWPRVESDPPTLARLYDHSVRHLHHLRLGLQGEDLELLGAGRPAYLALFGRDSLIIGLAALPFRPRLAHDALRVLGRIQGRRVDLCTEEQPGRIMHELRVGESVRFGVKPPADFGSADAPALFVTLLDEYVARTGDRRLARELEQPARAALAWLAEFGDADGDAFIEYQRKNRESGIVNQTWKDSDDAIVYPDGTVAEAPIAASEIQGYAYDAYRRGARLARGAWRDPALAAELARRADRLRVRFDEVFWLPEQGSFGMALDRQKRLVPTVCSSLGQLLATGIVRRERGRAVAEALLAPELFSGWGIRTVAAGTAAHDPLGYHRGTVWPHDTAIAALGLARYGYQAEAERIADALLAAAVGFGFRLPELFAGFGRDAFPLPVEYPDAARPLGMASAAVLILLRALFGTALDGPGAEIRPDLPELAVARFQRPQHRSVP